MNDLILNLRRALADYEICVNTDAAEHVTGKCLINLQNTAYAVAKEASKMLNEM